MSRTIRIKDVAEHAGVSVTTVSHVLNDVPGKRINGETRARVKASAAALGYVPNRVARSLRTRRSQVLALISDEIATTPFAGLMILGAQEAASKRGWLLMLVNTGLDPAYEAREIQALLQRQVDGFLYATMYHREVELPDELAGLPVVLLDAVSRDSSIPSVVPDEVGGGRTATEVLLASGHRRIAFLNNSDDIPASHGRLEGYRAALEAAGVHYHESLVRYDASDSAGGYRAAADVLDRTARPTALFCFNDRMALGAYQAAAERGLRIPHDLSVVGFDNQEIIADGLRPGLTTVALPHYEMGAWAVETLIGSIDDSPQNDDRARVVLPCPLVSRASVAAPGQTPG